MHEGAAAILRAIIPAFAACLAVGPARAAEQAAMFDAVKSLPAYRPAPAPADWLIDPSPCKAALFRGGDGEVVLSNGLICRTFRLRPNGATVAFDNRMTGQSLLRGVKSEAIVEIDGLRHEVGGLKGQPDYAYLKPEWLDRMPADPQAFRLVGLEWGRAKARLEWKRVRHCAPDAAWPPPGVSLRMDYEMPPAAMDQRLATPQDSAAGRERLLSDDFQQLDEAWRVHASKAHPRSSFRNEGKVGEIHTPANTAVFVERDLPPGVRLVEATIDPGTDRSASWGPGLALVWADRTVKFHLRPGGSAETADPQFGVYDGQAERLISPEGWAVDLARPTALRLRLGEDAIHCDARRQEGPWRTVHTIALRTPPGDPQRVRVGKLGKAGGAADHPEAGDLVRLRVLGFAARGALRDGALAERRRRLEDARKLRVSVHYELYDGLPCLSKWITVHNPTGREVVVNRFTSEVLAAVEHGSAVEFRGRAFRTPNIHVETDYAFGGFTPLNTTQWSVHWLPDPDYGTQVNYLRKTPCLLEVRPTVGPEQTVPPGGTFESFRAFLLPHDSTDRERRGLALRRMYRTIAPWVTENPLMMHVRYADPKTVRAAIDQCAEVGFEMVILTFGSGFNIENDSPEYLARMKQYADYARSKGIEIGGYSLLASRRVGGGNDVVSPPGTRPTFGNSPALASEWGREYFRKLYRFFPETGFALLEHDGSYPGDLDDAPRPPLQKGLADSRWVQWRILTDFYKSCRARGVYLNVPDYYYLAGSSKCGMGYRETNWSLPRAQQVIHTRQNIHDGTWQKTPSMGWMFVPLTQYHGGGAAATIEPLDAHRDHYERMLYSNLAMGVQACYRGPRLYDTDRTRDLVRKWVRWFRTYRDILESDMIHGRRADARDIDWMLHVNPRLKHKGMLVAFNPLDAAIERTIRVDLYYTGLTDTARIRQEEGKPAEHRLDRRYGIDLPVRIGPQGMTWFVIE